jgi:hypothetical protein
LRLVVLAGTPLVSSRMPIGREWLSRVAHPSANELNFAAGGIKRPSSHFGEDSK